MGGALRRVFLTANVLLFSLVLLSTPTPTDGVWGLEQLYEDEILEYVQ